MAGGISFHIGFEDPKLLESTLDEYSLAVESGSLDESEAVDNLEALALGMMRMETD